MFDINICSCQILPSRLVVINITLKRVNNIILIIILVRIYLYRVYINDLILSSVNMLCYPPP